MIRIHSHHTQGQQWLNQYRGQPCEFVCVLGFTDTALIPGISAAGKTPQDRAFTALADGEFLVNGVVPNPVYPLPPLTQGASPVVISRAIAQGASIPIQVINGGLHHDPPMAAIAFPGVPARCLSTGQALPLSTVKQLWQAGWQWGQEYGATHGGYVVIGECVVGGTTTALGVLTALGWAVDGMVNSSHPQCNHGQKLALVAQGLRGKTLPLDPWAAIAAVGDPMQITVAAMAAGACDRVGVLLGGGTQMLAVVALLQAIAQGENLPIRWENLAVGTTKWVARDPTGNTVGLSELIGGVPLLASELDFSPSRYPQLRAYERGFVKEGVGAGAMAIAAQLSYGYGPQKILTLIEDLLHTLDPRADPPPRV